METQERDRGRPPKPPEERKSAELRIRLTAEEREALDRAAGENTSTWARDVLLRAAKRKA